MAGDPGSSTDKTARTELIDVTAISASDAWAVGAFFDPAREDDLFGSFALHWNGTSWRRLSLPTPVGYVELRIAGVTASGTNNVWAVGEVWDPERGIDRPAVFRWNGGAWTWVPSPAATRSAVDVGSVAVSGQDVWVVGSRRGDGVSATRPFAMHHNGTSWQVFGIPRSSEQWHWLTGVAIANNSRVWAAGTFRGGDPGIDVDQLPVVERWNGTRWSSATLSLPDRTNPDPSYSLSDVAAYGNDAIAVGPGLAYRRVPCG